MSETSIFLSKYGYFHIKMAYFLNEIAYFHTKMAIFE